MQRAETLCDIFDNDFDTKHKPVYGKIANKYEKRTKGKDEHAQNKQRELISPKSKILSPNKPEMTNSTTKSTNFFEQYYEQTPPLCVQGSRSTFDETQNNNISTKPKAQDLINKKHSNNFNRGM